MNRYARQQRLNPAEQTDPAMRSMMDAVRQVYTPEPQEEELPEDETVELTESVLGLKLAKKTIKERIDRALKAVRPPIKITETEIMALQDKLEPFQILDACGDAIRLANVEASPSENPDEYFMSKDSTMDQNAQRIGKQGMKLIKQCKQAVKSISGKDWSQLGGSQNLKMAEKVMAKLVSDAYGRKVFEGELHPLFGDDYSYMSNPWGAPSTPRGASMVWITLSKKKLLK